MATVDLGLVKGDQGKIGPQGPKGDTGGTFAVVETLYYDIATLKTDFLSLIGAGFNKLIGIYEINLSNYMPTSYESVTFKTSGNLTSVSFYDRSGTEITSLSSQTAEIKVVSMS